jgi:hypothetical protein
VHFRAQIGQKCTLFASESAKKGVFCRGEGRLFGRPKTGVFGVLAGPARDTSRREKFRVLAPLRTGFDTKIELKHLRFIPPLDIVDISLNKLTARGVLRTHRAQKWI